MKFLKRAYERGWRWGILTLWLTRPGGEVPHGLDFDTVPQVKYEA